MPPQKPVGNGYYGYEEVPNGNSTQLENGAVEDNLDTTQNDQTSLNDDNDFAEYLWMENEEEFDQQVLQQLEEEELMEQCLEAMLEEERSNLMTERMYINNIQSSEGSGNQDIMNIVNNFKLDLVDIEKSTLNPLAAEFVPDSNISKSVYSTNRE